MIPPSITPSKLTDRVWKAPSKSNGKYNIHFDGVFARNPRMRATVKHYLWARLHGFRGTKAASWQTVLIMLGRLRSVAEAMEASGWDCFSRATPAWVFAHWESSDKSYGTKQKIGDLLGMFRAGVSPNLPKANPLQSVLPRDFHPVKRTRQTPFFTDEWFQRLVRRAMEGKQRAEGLRRLRRTRNWDGAAARELKVRGLRDLNRETMLCRMAGAVCVLAATGMRRGELLSLRIGSLRCLQKNGSVWVLWGKAYKFHGRGTPARWVCGELGREGYRILSLLAETDGPLLPGRKTPLMGMTPFGLWLARWANAQRWGAETPEVRPHRFRRTLARLLVRNGVTILGVKEQFKHKAVTMSDYYVGNDGELYAQLLRARPEADLADYQRKALAELDAAETEEP